MRSLSDLTVVASPREHRLVLRVLDVWRRACGDHDCPAAGSITLAEFGDDADHVFVVDLRRAERPRFASIGTAVGAGGWPGGVEAELSGCPDDSILSEASRHWREVVERRVPVSRGGVGVNEGAPVLYRGIMMPLVDEDGRVVEILGAANWRIVEEAHGIVSD